MPDYLLDSTEGEWRPHPRFEGAFVKPLITSEMSPDLTLNRVKLLRGGELPHHTQSLHGDLLCAQRRGPLPHRR